MDVSRLSGDVALDISGLSDDVAVDVSDLFDDVALGISALSDESCQMSVVALAVMRAVMCSWIHHVFRRVFLTRCVLVYH